ncbi:MAG: flagellar basal-body rod protein FlgG [Ignavibacteriae bacterium HGW-Ignavibacteriae-3]|nr:MAG: flagellar basal-body rod protein FlgG [Ignavibacteriae bacterium HGW-Ignavibacteriae-3]
MSERALRTAASGMYAQQINIEVISNNIANINTTGYKKNKADFQDLMYQQVSINPLTSSAPGVEDTSTTKIQIGNGVKPSSTIKLFMQGDITPTNNQFDVAIQGEGFFQVRKNDGSFAYTRDGSFKVSAEGRIVTASGYTLEPGITLSPDISSLSIGKDGTVAANLLDGSVTVLGNIELARFMNNGGLIALGDNLYSESSSSGQPLLGTPGDQGFGEVHQGYLESSNVDIVEEMIAMIAAQRAYEINSKTVKTVEDMMSMANNLKRA